MVAIASAVTIAGIAEAHRYQIDLQSRVGGDAITVVLHRDGGVMMAGKDDARLGRSGVVGRNGLDWVDMPGFAGDDAEWQELVGCVREEYAGLAVEIVDTPPVRGDYIFTMVGGTPDAFGFDETVGGIAPWNGRVISDAVVFAFQPPDLSSRRLCENTAHEIGHALGLDHSRDCSDLMSYEMCGPKHFRDEPALCGEWEDRPCGSGRDSQRSAEELARRVGREHEAELPRLLALHTGLLPGAQ